MIICVRNGDGKICIFLMYNFIVIEPSLYYGQVLWMWGLQLGEWLNGGMYKEMMHVYEASVMCMVGQWAPNQL